MDKIYIVINIYRINSMAMKYAIALYSDKIEYFVVDSSLSTRMSKGMIFIEDQVTITDITDDGIIFQIAEGERRDNVNIPSNIEDEMSVFYGKVPIQVTPNTNVKYTFLPYLCDVLPYSNQEIVEMKANPMFRNNTFLGKYMVGDDEVSNIRMPLPSTFVAKIHQKTRINTYPTVFNPFFFIIVSSNNIYLKLVFWAEHLGSFSNLKVGEVIMVTEYKAKKKYIYKERVELNTFTESVYFNCEEITVKNLVKIKVDKKGPSPSLFSSVEGTVEYLSVLMRYSINDSLMEYVLMRIGQRNVVLFYNSDLNFYNIRVKSNIRINEMRKVNRAGFEFYVSTIYTQFEMTEGDTENIKRVKIHENEANTCPPCIFGAIGFIPDNFESLADVLDYSRTETIHSQDVYFNLFMKPYAVSLEDLKKQDLLLNETKKFLIKTYISDITDIECTIDYFEDGSSKKQTSFKIVFEGKVECFVYDNFFESRPANQKSKNEFTNLKSKEMYFVIEGLRIDESTVLYYLTGEVPVKNN